MFSEKLKQRREEKGLTQEEVASFFGSEFSRQSVCKWERNDGYPEVDKLLILSVKLGISLDELFSDEIVYLKKLPVGSTKDAYPGLVAFLNAFADSWAKNKKL